METEVIPVHDQHSLIYSHYPTWNLQPNSWSHNIVTSPSVFWPKKQTLQSRFLHFVDLCLSNDIFATTSNKSTIIFLHSETVLKFIFSLDPNCICIPQNFSENRGRKRDKIILHRTSLSQLRSSFCSYFHSYRESIGLTSSLLCPSCRREPNATRSSFLLFFASHISERKTHLGTFAHAKHVENFKRHAAVISIAQIV